MVSPSKEGIVSDTGAVPQANPMTAAEIRFNSPAATEARLEERIRTLEAALRAIEASPSARTSTKRRARAALAGEPTEREATND